MKSFTNIGRASGMRRFGVMTRILVKHGLGDVADRLLKRGPQTETKGAPYPSPARVRRVLEELGPSFVKLGQLMSTRADIFPPEHIEEFKKLQDQVPPVPFALIRPVIESELKQPLAEIFAEFEEKPLAAASVAQVHLARLHSGEPVAVKVVRPGIRRKIKEDIQVMHYVAAKLEKGSEFGAVLGLSNIVQEFERTVFKELDMFIEAGNIERFGVNFRDSEEIYIGKVYWDYIGKSVLVMEHIEGIKMDRVAEIEALGIDPKEIALIGLRSFSRQLMEFGLFHADPHPANTLVLKDGRVGLIDFGIIGYLDEETMMQIANIFLGYAEHDYNMVMAALLDAGIIDEEQIDLKGFKADLKDMSEPFYGRSLKTVSVKDVYEQVIRLVLKYRIILPRDFLLLLKTFVQTESLGKILDSDASLLEVTRPYAQALLKRGYDAQRLLRNIGRDARQMGGHVRLLPKLLHDLMRQIVNGKQGLEIRLSGFDNLENKLDRGINRLTVGFVLSASIIAASLVLNSSQKVITFTVNWGGVHIISITSILGLIGYSLATILGFWLIISIFRSGKM